MAVHVAANEIQAWLETTKLNIGNAVDVDLEEAASALVLGTLGQSYDTSSWVSPQTTPLLVRKVVAMLIAAWLVQRQYAEDSTDTNSYANWLEGKAMALLAALDVGTIDLLDVAGAPPLSIGKADFWPNDSTEVLDANEAAFAKMSNVF